MIRFCAFAIALVCLVPKEARAQACCAGASAILPGRLEPGEDELVGIAARNADAVGSYTWSGTYAAAPRGTAEADFEQDFFATKRFFHHMQLGVVLPFVETYRRSGGISELGGGVGDVSLSARYDVPGVTPNLAVLGSFTLPTGRSVEQATNNGRPLATDATGTGSAQGMLGLSAEYIPGNWLFGATALFTLRAGRTESGVSTSTSAQATAILAAAYAFSAGQAVALVGSYAAEPNAKVDGMIVPHSSRRTTTISAAVSLPLSTRFRGQAALSMTPPVSGLGVNSPATLGLTLTLVYLVSGSAVCPPRREDDRIVTMGPEAVSPF